MIVKIQRPVTSNDADMPWLIYNERQTYHVMIADADIPAEVKRAMRGDFKAYFNATFVNARVSDALEINERIAAQDW